MQELVEFIVKSIVEDKEAVVVNKTQDEKSVLLKVMVNPNDLGQVIGKNGNIAQSIRTIVKSVYPHQRVRIKFEAK